MKKYPVRSLDMKRYAETFGVFLKRSLEYPLITENLGRIIRSLPGRFEMLDVGAGNGVILETLCQHGLKPTAYTAFEPNPQHLLSLRSVCSKLELSRCDIYPLSFEHTTLLTQNYDLALFSHSLYWMRDAVRSFQSAVKALKPRGVCVAILQAPYDVHAAHRLFGPLMDRSGPMLQNNAYSSFELVNGLREIGFDPCVEVIPTPIDLTGLFLPQSREDLTELLSFIFQAEFSEFEEPLRTDIIQYVAGGCVELDNRTLWYLPNAFVTLKQETTIV